MAGEGEVRVSAGALAAIAIAGAVGVVVGEVVKGTFGVPSVVKAMGAVAVVAGVAKVAGAVEVAGVTVGTTRLSALA